ncbi:MAG: endonuclease/exonuclease/phosphatase family protein [Polyangiales bacterium]
MKRSFSWIVIVVSLAGCGDDGGEPEPQEVVIDTFNVALAGAFIPYEEERRQPIADAIAAQTSDIICLQEVWDQTDKELIEGAAADAYPYVVAFEDDLDTPVDDPTDQQGEIPPAPTVVPCPDVEVTGIPGLTIQDQMNQAIDCVRDNCSTIPGSDEGYTTSADCAADECTTAVAGLLLGADPQQQLCYACVVTQLPTAQLGYIRSSCAEIVNQDLAFNGQNGVMLLSRHPLENAEEWVLPGTWNRRTILHATVKLPNGADLDAYCNHLTPIFDDFTFPYTGQYGDGFTDARGWQAEQELQAQKLIDFVANTSGDRPAVVLGDLNASHAYPAQDIVAEGEPTLDLLETEFDPAYASDYTPQCTFCSTNPVTNPTNDPTATSGWIDHILLYNLPADAVVSTTRVYDEPVVPVDSQTVPLSDHYGMRSVVTVP